MLLRTSAAPVRKGSKLQPDDLLSAVKRVQKWAWCIDFNGTVGLVGIGVFGLVAVATESEVSTNKLLSTAEMNAVGKMTFFLPMRLLHWFWQLHLPSNPYCYQLAHISWWMHLLPIFGLVPILEGGWLLWHPAWPCNGMVLTKSRVSWPILCQWSQKCERVNCMALIGFSPFNGCAPVWEQKAGGKFGEFKLVHFGVIICKIGGQGGYISMPEWFSTSQRFFRYIFWSNAKTFPIEWRQSVPIWWQKHHWKMY